MAALRPIAVRNRTAPYGSKPARDAMPTPIPSASSSCERENPASAIFDFASVSALICGSLNTSVATRLMSAAWRAWSSRIAAWRAITCAISCESTEASSALSLASDNNPRVT